jgi:hypothetical protein
MIGGDPSGMIGRGAKASAKKMTDDPTFATIGWYRKAHEKHDDAIDAVAQYQEATNKRMVHFPGAKIIPYRKTCGEVWREHTSRRVGRPATWS